ncbi:MAG: hypothetical protein JXR97_11055, partial [Planctomycetes bacterium]|nr:hypothetical protein [Planctomycetota bacterium]
MPERVGDENVGKNTCPSCEGEVGSGAVVCIGCGYDFRTGEKIEPKIETSPSGSLANAVDLPENITPPEPYLNPAGYSPTSALFAFVLSSATSVILGVAYAAVCFYFPEMVRQLGQIMAAVFFALLSGALTTLIADRVGQVTIRSLAAGMAFACGFILIYSAWVAHLGLAVNGWHGFTP